MKIYFLHSPEFEDSVKLEITLCEMKEFIRLKNFQFEEVDAKSMYGTFLLKKFSIKKIPSLILIEEMEESKSSYSLIAGNIQKAELELAISNFVKTNIAGITLPN